MTPFAAPASLPVVVIPARTVLWRVHPRGRGALWFGTDPSRPPAGRFDAPGHEFGVCYFGDSLEAAMVETLIRSPGPLRSIELRQLEQRSVSQVLTHEALTVVQLEGAGLVRLGVSANQAHAQPYDECQQMALAFWRHAGGVDGIQYRSRWDSGRLCWALFDRAAPRLAQPVATQWLGDTNVSRAVLDYYDIGIV